MVSNPYVPTPGWLEFTQFSEEGLGEKVRIMAALVILVQPATTASCGTVVWLSNNAIIGVEEKPDEVWKAYLETCKLLREETERYLADPPEAMERTQEATPG